MSRPQIVCHLPGSPIICDLDRGRYDGFTDDAVAFLEETLADCRDSAAGHDLAGRIAASQGWKQLVDSVLFRCNWGSESLLSWLSQGHESPLSPASSIHALTRICTLTIDFADFTQLGYAGPEHLLVGILQDRIERHPVECRAAAFLESWKNFTEDGLVAGADASKRSRNVFSRLRMAKARPHDRALMEEVRRDYDGILVAFLKAQAIHDTDDADKFANRVLRVFEGAVMSFEGTNLPQFNNVLSEALTEI